MALTREGLVLYLQQCTRAFLITKKKESRLDLVELAGEAHRVERSSVRQGRHHGAVESEHALVADVIVRRRSPEVGYR